MNRRHLQHRQRIREDDDRIDDPARKAEFRPRENERRYEDDAQRDRRAGLLRKPADLRDERQRSGDERFRGTDDEAKGEDGDRGADHRPDRSAAEIEIVKRDVAREERRDQDDVSAREMGVAFAERDNRRGSRRQLLRRASSRAGRAPIDKRRPGLRRERR